VECGVSDVGYGMWDVICRIFWEASPITDSDNSAQSRAGTKSLTDSRCVTVGHRKILHFSGKYRDDLDQPILIIIIRQMIDGGRNDSSTTCPGLYSMSQSYSSKSQQSILGLNCVCDTLRWRNICNSRRIAFWYELVAVPLSQSIHCLRAPSGASRQSPVRSRPIYVSLCRKNQTKSGFMTQ
jgi:hypothetical protein